MESKPVSMKCSEPKVQFSLWQNLVHLSELSKQGPIIVNSLQKKNWVSNSFCLLSMQTSGWLTRESIVNNCILVLQSIISQGESKKDTGKCAKNGYHWVNS